MSQWHPVHRPSPARLGRRCRRCHGFQNSWPLLGTFGTTQSLRS